MKAAQAEITAARRTVYTTGRIGKLCGVAPRTVSKWFDSGRLRGYRIPGSQDRRVPEQDLHRFLAEHGMPTDELEHNIFVHVLMIGADPVLIDGLAEHLRETHGRRWRLIECSSTFCAGAAAAKHHPHVVVIDLTVGPTQTGQIADAMAGQCAVISFDRLTVPLSSLAAAIRAAVCPGNR
jgi:two-component system response regulator RpaA